MGLRTPALLTLAAVGIKTGDLRIHHPSLSLTIYRIGRMMTISVKKDAGPTQDLALAISLPPFRNPRSSCLVTDGPPFLYYLILFDQELTWRRSQCLLSNNSFSVLFLGLPQFCLPQRNLSQGSSSHTRFQETSSLNVSLLK